MIFQPRDHGEIRVLLDLAMDPRHDVQSTMETGRLAVVIPDYLYERYKRYQSLESSSPKEPEKSGSLK